MASFTWRSAVTVILLATLSPYLFDTFRVLKAMTLDKNEWRSEATDLAHSQIKFADSLRNCEDVVLEPARGFALLSCSPGRDKWNTVMGHFVDSSEHGSIYLYQYADSPNDPPVLLPLDGFDAPFHPLGLTYHSDSKTLAITNHGGNDASVEVFTLDLAAQKLKFRQSLTDPEHLRTPNSIVFLNSTHIYVSNTHRLRVRNKPQSFAEQLYLSLSKLELRTGLPTGSVSLVDLNTGTARKVLGLGFANGVDLLDGGRTLAVAATSKTAVYFYDIADDPSQPIFVRRVITPFFPDNLSVDGNGHVLIAGHPDPSALGLMVRGNSQCHGTLESADPCFKASSWVAELDPQTELPTSLRNLYVGNSYPSSSGVVCDAERNVVIIAGLYADGLLVGRK